MLTRLGVPKLWGNDPERFWEFARAFMVGFLRRVAPTYAYGVERIPTTGGAVVAANHFGTGDPISLDGLPLTGRGYKEGAAILEAELTRLWRQAAEAVAAGFPERLADGTPRSGPLPTERTFPVRGVRPWPEEEWAAGPLGPVYRASRR